MSDLPFDPEEIEAAVPGQESKQPRLIGGVPEYTYTTDPVTGERVPMRDPETGRPIPYSTARQTDWGSERRLPGGGLTYDERRYTQITFPRFRDGDQYDIYSFTPQRITQLQRSLIAAGLLDPDEIEGYGYVGPAAMDSTFAAYERAMEFANQAGFDSVDQALISLQSGRYGTGPGGTRSQRDGGGSGGRLPSQISNADDLRRVFRAAVIDELGRGWDEGRIDQMVGAYQALERGQVERAEAIARAAAERAEATGEDVSSGTIEGLPNPETFALDFARRQDPLGAQATDFVGAANTFFQLLGQWQPPAGDLPS